MNNFGTDCHSNCPSEWKEDGLFCRPTEYERGLGYPRKLGDGSDDKGMFSRCETLNGMGNCEKNGAIVYPKCKFGYSNVGYSTCRPNTPNCADFNLNSIKNIDLSCGKKIITREPLIGTCGENEVKSAGLCYPKCNSGYSGVGSICLGQPPSGWETCGMGAATRSKCATLNLGKVTNVATIAANIVKLGDSSAETDGAKVERFTQIKDMFESMNKIYDENKVIFDAAQQLVKNDLIIKNSFTSINNVLKLGKHDDAAAEDIARTAAEIATTFHPSGATGKLDTDTYSKCSQFPGSPLHF